MSAGAMRPRLVAVWLVFAALVGAIVVIEYTDLVGPRSRRAGGGQEDGDARLLLPVPVDRLGAIEVARAGTLHRFERDAAGAWFYHGVHTGSEGAHAHQVDPSTAERIEQAFTVFGRARIERQFALGENAGRYGVAVPQILILVYRPNDLQPLVQYAVGDVAPDTHSRYVTAVGSATVATIPNYQIDNLLELIRAVAGEADRGQVTRGSS